MKANFAESLEFGRAGESKIANWLKDRGHMVLPAYEIEQGGYKGPQIFGKKESLVAPDLLVFSGGRKALWAETKRKNAFTWHRATNKWVTGLDLHHFTQYLYVMQRTGFDVWLFFLHEKSEPSDIDRAHVIRAVNNGILQSAESPTGIYFNEIKEVIKGMSHTCKSGINSGGYGSSGMIYFGTHAFRDPISLDEIEGI